MLSGNVGIAGKGMTDQDRVVFIVIQLAKSLVSNGDGAKFEATLKELLVRRLPIDEGLFTYLQGLCFRECLFNVSKNVINMLDAHRKSDHGVRYSCFLQLFG